MINSDVQLFWANDENGDIAIIFDMVEEDRNKKYTCPVCGSDVKPVALEGKTKDGKVAQVSSHFSHFDASKCNSESAVHWWFKNKILLNGDNFIIKTDVENEYKCKEVLIEQFYRTEFGIYRPDITIITECDKTIYFEMNYTNKKKIEDYMDKWLELGNPVVEVDIKMLMEASFNKSTYEFRALFYEGKCFNTKKNDLYYDTIGQLKERICKNNIIDNEIRERIRKLDWFWMETINYKRGETNIEQLVDYIDYSEQDEKDLIFIILSKKRCVSIYEDYINYKVELFEKLANNYIGRLEDGIYKEYFLISKIKVGRKNKNIIYNTIQLNNNYYKNLCLDFEVIKYTKEQYYESSVENVDNIIELIPYHNKIKDIYLKIKSNYLDKLNNDVIYYIDKQYDDLYLSITQSNNINDNFLYKITLKDWYTTYSSIYVSLDHIRCECNNKKKEIKLDIIDDKNYNKSVEFISNIMCDGIDLYNQNLIEKEEKKLKEKIEMEIKNKIYEQKALLEIKENRQNFSKQLLNISNIFENHKEKIVNYCLDYILDNKYDNLLYFKDYRDLEFIIYSDSYLHDPEGIKKYYYNNDFDLSLKKSNCKLIKIERYLDNKIYITEINNDYEIDNNLQKPEYKFTKLFNKELNLSFKYIGKNTKSLLRYDFLNAEKQIKEILKNVSELKYSFPIHNSDLYCNKIYDIPEITDEEINKKIFKVLYPIVCLSEKNNDDILKIQLNSDFTIENGNKKPWLIKGFVESLSKIGVKAFNII